MFDTSEAINAKKQEIFSSYNFSEGENELADVVFEMAHSMYEYGADIPLGVLFSYIFDFAKKVQSMKK